MTQKHHPTPLFDNIDELKSSLNDLDITLRSFPEKAKQDYQHACQFLLSYRGSQATFNAYRREIERLMQWCYFLAFKTLSELSVQDIENYVIFCQHPPKEWIAVRNVPRFILKNGLRSPNFAWRPFVANVSKKSFRDGKSANVGNYSLSQNALQSIFAICGSFYKYLIQENYVESNPVAMIRQKSKYFRRQQHKKVIRKLSELQWSYVFETVEKMATENPTVHERSLFIMTALYAMYLRVSELAASERWTPQMGDFLMDNDGNWWFTTVGKGNKERIISVSDEMLEALKRYRLSRGFVALPSRAETTPLIPNLKGNAPLASTRMIRKIVQSCFDAAITRMIADGFTEEAEMLADATVHWLRHTGISEDVKHRPKEHVRDDAGHSSSAITDKYVDVELQERARSAKKKKVKP